MHDDLLNARSEMSHRYCNSYWKILFSNVGHQLYSGIPYRTVLSKLYESWPFVVCDICVQRPRGRVEEREYVKFFKVVACEF